jgi:two-component system response regulator AtoC
VSLQAKWLQVLQDGSYSRLGSRTTHRTNVRVVSATNIPMKESIANGTFREAVYYRLNGISIKLPPLRDRMDELQILIRHFMKKGSDRFNLEPLPISTNLLEALREYHWPGNIRELENVINRLLVLRQESAVMEELRPGASVSPSVPAPNGLSLKDMMDNVREETESVAIVRVLEEKRWNRRAAADELQISYKSLLSKIKQYGIAPR